MVKQVRRYANRGQCGTAVFDDQAKYRYGNVLLYLLVVGQVVPKVHCSDLITNWNFASDLFSFAYVNTNPKSAFKMYCTVENVYNEIIQWSYWYGWKSLDRR